MWLVLSSRMHDLRPTFDRRQEAACPIRVFGYRQHLTGITGDVHGSDSWFVFVFHERIPIPIPGGMSQPESVLIHAPGDPIRHGHAGSWLRSWIRCQAGELDALLTRSGLCRNVLYPVHEAGLHERWLGAIHEELQHPRGWQRENLLALIGLWWRHIARATSLPPRIPEAVLLARQLIEERFREELRLETLARSVGSSRTRLCHGFRSAYGTSPMQYALHLRLAFAAELLRGSDQSIAAIAQACGFNDEYYFSRAFRKHYGRPPGVWRR